jgi:hypothetical protein
MANQTERLRLKSGFAYRNYEETVSGQHAPETYAPGAKYVFITPTITTDTNAHTSGDLIGGKITLTGALRTGQSGILRGITIVDQDDQKPQCSIILLTGAATTTGTYTQNAAPTWTAADMGKIVARIPLVTADYVTVTTGTSIGQLNLSVPVYATTTADLHCLIVTTSTPTFTNATSKFRVTFAFEQR